MKDIHKYNQIDIEKINYLNPEKKGASYFGALSYGSYLKPLYSIDIHDIFYFVV